MIKKIVEYLGSTSTDKLPWYGVLPIQSDQNESLLEIIAKAKSRCKSFKMLAITSITEKNKSYKCALRNEYLTESKVSKGEKY